MESGDLRDAWDWVQESKTISGLDLYVGSDPVATKLTLRLHAYSEEQAMLFECGFTGDIRDQFAHLLKASASDDLGDPSSQPPWFPDVARAFHLMDQFVRSLVAADSSFALLSVWDEMTDACRESYGLYMYHLLTEDRGARTRLASHAAKQKHAKSGSAAIRPSVKELWVSWRERPERYRSKAAFALDMLDKYPGVVSSPVTIARWIAEWEGEKLK